MTENCTFKVQPGAKTYPSSLITSDDNGNNNDSATLSKRQRQRVRQRETVKELPWPHPPMNPPMMKSTGTLRNLNGVFKPTKRPKETPTTKMER
jgi:hypothetical protein